MEPTHRVVRVLGAVVLAGLVVAGLPGLDAEARDWVAYVVAVFFAGGAALFGGGRIGRVVGGGLTALAVLAVAVELGVDAYQILGEAVALRDGAHAGTLPLAAVGVLLVGPALALLWRPRAGDEGAHDADARPPLAFALVASLAAVTMLPVYLAKRSPDGALGAAAFAVATLWTWRALASRPRAPAPRWALALVDVGLVAGLALAAVVPLYPGLSVVQAEHWGFFVGPITWAKQGRLLLWEIPSQYGFGAVLLPAALPLASSWTSFHVALVAGVAAVGLAAWAALRPGATTLAARTWAAAAVLLGVWLFSGDRGTPHAGLAFPSSSAYRFLWVLLLALHLRRGGRAARDVAVTCALVAAGVAWSVESAAWCLVTVGTVAFADGVVRLLGREGGVGARAWARAWVPPLLVPAVVVGVVVAVYRVAFGVTPDPRAFAEYAGSYAGGHFSLRIEPSAGIVAVVVAIATALAFGVDVLGRGRRPEDAGLLAPYAAMTATTTYFVSRSHDSNAANLMATWLPLLLLLLHEARARGLRAWVGVLRALVAPLFVAMGVVVVGPGRPWAALLERMDAPAASVDATLPRRDQPLLHLRGLAPAFAELPGFNLTLSPPIVGVDALPFEPWLPIYPWNEADVLPEERQATYLGRFARRGLPPEGWLLRRARGAHRQRAVDAFLRRHYELVETRSLDEGFRLERWRVRGGGLPAGGPATR